MAQMQVFVSHNHRDEIVCHAIVAALREAGADVWYDEHNLGPGHVRRVIMQELVRRPVFIVVLSKAALASQWVLDECDWAYDLQRDEPSRILLPVVVEPLERADFNVALHLYSLNRVEAPGMQPYPIEEAIRRLLHVLSLTPVGEALASSAPGLRESAADLLERAKALWAQKRYGEMMPLAQRATELAPNVFDAWFNLGRALSGLKRYDEALAAYDRALALNPNHTLSWSNRGGALYGLKRYDEALDAYDCALVLDPGLAAAWSGKGTVLFGLQRYDEALTHFDHALTIDPVNAHAASSRAYPLRALGREAEAEEAERRAKELGG